MQASGSFLQTQSHNIIPAVGAPRPRPAPRRSSPRHSPPRGVSCGPFASPEECLTGGGGGGGGRGGGAVDVSFIILFRLRHCVQSAVSLNFCSLREGLIRDM